MRVEFRGEAGAKLVGDHLALVQEMVSRFETSATRSAGDLDAAVLADDPAEVAALVGGRGLVRPSGRGVAVVHRTRA